MWWLSACGLSDQYHYSWSDISLSFSACSALPLCLLKQNWSRISLKLSSKSALPMHTHDLHFITKTTWHTTRNNTIIRCMWAFVCPVPSSASCLSLTDSDCVRRVFRFCPWELPLCLPVRSSPAMYPLSVPQWELPTWRANQQMVPCWNIFPLPFILLSYCNNLESLPAVPEDLLCFEAYSLSAEVSCANTMSYFLWKTSVRFAGIKQMDWWESKLFCLHIFLLIYSMHNK